MNEYNFVVDASAFEKGLGNIKRWSSECCGAVRIAFYLPTYTLNELEYMQSRRKSFAARESLKFIDSLTNESPYDSAETQQQRQRQIDVAVEFPEVLSCVPWDHVNVHRIGAIDRLPRRLKNLLRSAAYKCAASENDDGKRWILLAEDPQIRQYARDCEIPCCSIVDVDNILSRELNLKSFRNSERFNSMVRGSGTERVDDSGASVVLTDFDKPLYAARGSGKLWTP